MTRREGLQVRALHDVDPEREAAVDNGGVRRWRLAGALYMDEPERGWIETVVLAGGDPRLDDEVDALPADRLDVDRGLVDAIVHPGYPPRRVRLGRPVTASRG